MRLVEEAVLELVTVSVMAEEQASNIELRAALIQAARIHPIDTATLRCVPLRHTGHDRKAGTKARVVECIATAGGDKTFKLPHKRSHGK